MNAAAPRRNLAKSLAAIANFVSASPAEAPGEFVRELARRWKERGGNVAGKPRHSDRYLDEFLRLLGTPVKSLTPKLGGRTQLRPSDADILVRLFLSHWTYVGGDVSRSGAMTAPSSDLYEPMLPEEDIAEVGAQVAVWIKTVGKVTAVAGEVRAQAELVQASAMPGEDMGDILIREFRDADAMFVVGAGQTMLVTQPQSALVDFRDIMERLWAVEKADPRGRMMVWMLELGRQRFEDRESRARFLNVVQVLARFKAMKKFRESVDGVSEARWNWLRSNAAIVLHDTSTSHPPSKWLPTFDAHHILFSAVPVRWVNSRSFRILYGDDGDRMAEANYTIFLRKSERQFSSSSGSRQRYELRYFGNAMLPNEQGELQRRGLELTAPGESYTEALGTVYLAAAHLLGLPSIAAEVFIDNLKIGQAHAKEKLSHHGLLLFSLDEFMKF